MDNHNMFIVGETGVLFKKDASGFPHPIGVDCVIAEDGTVDGKIISLNPMFMEAIEFINYVRRQRDKKTGKYKTIPLFPYQTATFLMIINNLVFKKSSKELMAWARQSGKSELIKLLVGWSMVFALKYIDTDVERFNLVLGGFENSKVQKLFKECKRYIYKAVDFYNDRHRDRLLTKKDNPSILDNDVKFEINKRFPDGEIIPYSQGFAITCSKNQDSLTSHLTIIDEAGLINNELYDVSISPFSTTTAGSQCFFGVPGFDNSSLIHVKYKAEEIKKIVFKFIDVYTYRLMVNKSLADNYKSSYDSFVRVNGKLSSATKWNYDMDFMDMNGKFCTKKMLEDSNVLTEEINMPINDRDNKSVYLVAGLDISPKKDYRVLTCMYTNVISGAIYNRVFDMKTYNKEKTRMEHEEVALTVALDLKMYKIDMLCIDSTSHQSYFVQTLRRKISEVGINTLIIPFYYNQSSKPRLFGMLEDLMHSGRLKLLKEDQSWESKKLVSEMCNLIREKGKKNNDNIKYYAPQGDDFSDDHVNSLALANICFREAFEKFRKREFADDGAKRWRIKLNKFSELEEIQYNVVKKTNIKPIYNVML